MDLESEFVIRLVKGEEGQLSVNGARLDGYCPDCTVEGLCENGQGRPWWAPGEACVISNCLLLSYIHTWVSLHRKKTVSAGMSEAFCQLGAGVHQRCQENMFTSVLLLILSLFADFNKVILKQNKAQTHKRVGCEKKDQMHA